jgi:phosphoribosylformylglycinamidine synthase
MGATTTNEEDRTATHRHPIWRAEIVVLPKPSVNDPEGEAIRDGLHHLAYSGVQQVRAGRFFQITIAAPTAAEAETEVGSMCDRLLANPVIETYQVRHLERVTDEDKCR